MNENHGITVDNLLRSLPPALANDDQMYALAESMAELLTVQLPDVEQSVIYTRIDELPSELLDILAYDFRVDWWDANYSVAEKRRTLKESWNVHRHLGTPAAVETAISAVYPNAVVSEWFEYGGQPYHFKICIDATYEDVDPIRHQRVLDRVNYYKNARSHMDEVEYIARPDGTAIAHAGLCAAGIGITIEQEVHAYGMG